jgi:hypothetical protein
MAPLTLAAQPAKEPYAPGLGEFTTATQLAMRSFGLPDGRRTGTWRVTRSMSSRKGSKTPPNSFLPMTGFRVADMIKSNTQAPLDELEKAVDAKSSAKFMAAFDKLSMGCNSCHAEAKKPFIKIQRPTAAPLTNQVFRP